MDGPSDCAPCSYKENIVFDVRPLRSLAPMFPAALGQNTVHVPSVRPYICVSPFGPYPPGPPPFSPAFPCSVPAEAANPWPAPKPSSNGAANLGAHPPLPPFSPSFQTPPPFSQPLQMPPPFYPSYPAPPSFAPSFPAPPPPPPSSQALAGIIIPFDQDASPNLPESSSKRKKKKVMHLNCNNMGDTEIDGSSAKKAAKKKQPKKVYELSNGTVLPALPKGDPRESVEVVLMTYDALRRRMLQTEEASNVSKSANMKAAAILMASDLRANMGKRVGIVPGIEIGDIFYFRIEMCLIGLHSPTIGGIDYMAAKFDDGEDQIAISVVSAGVYENEESDVDALIYSGQGGGGSNKNDKKKVDDQKLKRGNLALERSLHRGNQIRVVRTAKDVNTLTGKIYIYDGLYKIQQSWTEKAKTGFNVFKYRMQREPGQPDGMAVWKMTQKWIDDPSSRGKVILPDISSGVENVPVSLVNDIDDEKGPSCFTYVTSIKHVKPINAGKPLLGCMCHSVCLPGSEDCSCAQQNGGELPYSSVGLLVRRKSLIYECNASCQCSENCRNRVTQKGVSLHFEVFRTRDRGWGLRSWDPIRSGTFICEYTGEIVDKVEEDDDGEKDEYIFQTTFTDDDEFKWNYGPELLGEPTPIDLKEINKPLPLIISAKNMGNISRFMNHSCSPNVFWQSIQHGHGDEKLPHIMFFAMKHIPPMTELTYDYGLTSAESGSLVDSSRKKKCLCGSLKCRGLFC